MPNDPQCGIDLSELDTILFQEGPPPIRIPSCDHYVGNPKFAAKAFTLQRDLPITFDVTLDFEDGAETGKELELLNGFESALLGRGTECKGRVGVRLPEIRSEHFQALFHGICERFGDKISFLTLPKAQGAVEVKLLHQMLSNDLSSSTGKLSKTCRLHILIESYGVLNDVREIAALALVSSLDFGIMDFISSHNGGIPIDACKGESQFTHALLRRAKEAICAAAYEFGKVATHNVTVEFSDTRQVEQDAKRARSEFGFQRMWSIHPSQIEPICQTFSSSPSEIEEAKEILNLAKKANWGPVSHHGTLHDRASYRYLWGVLSRAR